MFQRKRGSKQHHFSLVLTIFVCLALVLSGCAGGQSQSAANSTPASSAPPSPSAQPDGGNANADNNAVAYTVEHAMGKTTVPKTPERVVILVGDAVEASLALGYKPVGITKAWGVKPVYDHLKDQLEGVQILGDENQPNLEAIIALKPDLIIGSKLRQEKIYQQLSDIAPTVFSERIHSDMLINFKIYAAALNKKEEGDKLVADFDKRINDLRTKLGDKIDTKISLVRFYVEDKVRIYYNDTFAGGIIKKIGLKRPDVQNQDKFADIIGKERIPDLEGDILFYFTLEDEKGMTTKTEQAWQEEPLWKNLNVVKNGNAHKVDDGIWNSSGGIISANLLLDDLEKFLVK